MNYEMSRAAFKAYDIRGRVPQELNEAVAYRIGLAFADLFGARRVVVGRDVRLSSMELANALMKGLCDGGCNALDIGLCGTEMVYFATAHWKTDGGIMVTASHNPMDYNGMKLVRSEARPISGDTGLRELEELVVGGTVLSKKILSEQGTITQVSIMEAYRDHLLGYVAGDELKPFRIVVDSGNGCAGPIIDELERYLPFQFIKIQHEPDGTFPNGIPNPLLPDKRAVTAEAVRIHQADLGIAWDGDFDRCFLFDENGRFIEGYYMVGLLAKAFLQRQPGAKIIHDPRLTWNTIEEVTEADGVAIQSKTGHAFIKERMRAEDAVYGGEMSAHHYFKDFSYCDSGMIPWLLVAALMGQREQGLAALVDERITRYPVSGEINRIVSDASQVLKALTERYEKHACCKDLTDGIGFEFADWRFNVRMSNTEPVLRLNVESRGNEQLMKEKTAEILELIETLK